MESDPSAARRDLERRGFVFSRFVCVEIGDYAPCDVDWNQRDLAHVSHVHGALGAMPVAVSDDRSTSLLFQRVAGVRLPLAVSHLAITPQRHVYFTSFAWFVLFSESSFDVVDGRTRVEARFDVGSPRWLAFLHPWIGRLLRRNHAHIDDEDRPLRLRRAALRARGYAFTNDAPASYRRSLLVANDNVVAPATGSSWRHETEAFDDRPRTCVLGSDGHDGVRVEARAGEVVIYPRMCRHDGACLDEVRASDGALECPWHGRINPALARFRLDAPETQRVSTAIHDIELCQRVLTVVFKG